MYEHMYLPDDLDLDFRVTKRLVWRKNLQQRKNTISLTACALKIIKNSCLSIERGIENILRLLHEYQV